MLAAMELHVIADDLAGHSWYVELVADFIEDVEYFIASVDELIEPDA